MGEQADALRQALEESLVSGTRAALTFSAVVVGLAFVMSWRIPTDVVVGPDEPAADPFEPLEPLDPDPALRRVEPGPDQQDVEGEPTPWPSSTVSPSTRPRPQ